MQIEIHAEFTDSEKVKGFQEAGVEGRVAAVCGSGAWGVDQ